MMGLYGRVLREARRAANITQAELAARMNVSPQMVTMIERGERSAAQHEPTLLLAEFLRTKFMRLYSAWELSQVRPVDLRYLSPDARRLWCQWLRCTRLLAISDEEFDALMREHVDEKHPCGKET